MLSRCALFVALALALSPCAARADETVTDLTADVPGLAGRTWLDLLKQAMPNLEWTGEAGDHHATGTLTKPMRPLPPNPEHQDDAAIDIDYLAVARVEISGKPRWLVLGEQASFGVAPLMLFDAEGGGLLDAVDVVQDRLTSLDTGGPIPLGGGAMVVGVRNWHDNTGESFDLLTIVLIDKDRFSLIGESGSHGERTGDVMSAEDVSYAVRPDPGRARARIDATVTREIQRFAKDSDTPVGKPVKSTETVSYRWDAVKGRYEAVQAPRRERRTRQ